MTDKLTPKFTDNAELQSALARRYNGAKQTIEAHLADNEALRETLFNLRVLRVGNASFSDRKEWGLSDKKEESGYADPILQTTIVLTVENGGVPDVQTLEIALDINGQYKISPSDGSAYQETNSAARAANLVEGWHLTMQEKYDFDSNAAIKQARQTQTKAVEKPTVERR